MDNAMIPDEEYSKLYSDLKEAALALSDIFDSAYAMYSQMTETMINRPRIPDAKEAERLMDGLMDYANDPRFVELYKKLCRHIHRWYPDLVKEHVACFLEITKDDELSSAIDLPVEYDLFSVFKSD